MGKFILNIYNRIIEIPSNPPNRCWIRKYKLVTYNKFNQIKKVYTYFQYLCGLLSRQPLRQLSRPPSRLPSRPPSSWPSSRPLQYSLVHAQSLPCYKHKSNVILCDKCNRRAVLNVNRIPLSNSPRNNELLLSQKQLWHRRNADQSRATTSSPFFCLRRWSLGRRRKIPNFGLWIYIVVKKLNT